MVYSIELLYEERRFMMEKLLIMTDSNASISLKEAEKLHVYVIPMPFIMNGEEYYEGINIEESEFLNALRKGAKISTSQPSSYLLEEVFQEELKKYDDILFIPMSSGLSSSYQNAKQVAEAISPHIHVIDNHRVCIPLKESVLEACSMRDQGYSVHEIEDYLIKTQAKCSVYVYVDTLKYLKQGGRVKPAIALFATLLRIKPIISTRGSSFDMFSRCRTLKEGKKKMMNQLKIDIENEFKEEYEKGIMSISINHSGLYEEAEEFKNELIRNFPKAQFHFIQFFPLSAACHIGPDALGVAITINSFLLPKELLA